MKDFEILSGDHGPWARAPCIGKYPLPIFSKGTWCESQGSSIEDLLPREESSLPEGTPAPRPAHSWLFSNIQNSSWA